MSRRSHSVSPSPRPSKRARIGGLTPSDYREGVMLAPMVRSGALPTRLFALKHGAKLVWGPEIVDKAILHAKREVDPVTGVISYNGVSKAMFTTHPVEKPYLIYQIGSANPELAVQAAKVVMHDVAGIDLNCGCPKPFSTHAGMGAALLSTPDLLCSILTALREALPPEISVSAKIRLLPTQAETLELVERIVNTGVSALTVHCRTRNMRPREKALIERMREIVDFVKGMGRDVAILQNGDCIGFEDAKRIRRITGADSVMIASAAESNPTCFSSAPENNVESTLIPRYLRICKYLDNHWGSTKFCVTQFKGRNPTLSKAARMAVKDAIARAKKYEDVEALVGGADAWTGEREFVELVSVIEDPERTPSFLVAEPEPEVAVESAESLPQAEVPGEESAAKVDALFMTPPEPRPNPEPVGTGAPRLPSNELRMPMPALIAAHEGTAQSVVPPLA